MEESGRINGMMKRNTEGKETHILLANKGKRECTRKHKRKIKRCREEEE